MSARKDTPLQVNALTGSQAITPLNGSSHFNVTVEWGAGTSAGVVAVEAAPHKDYAGTWANLTSFTWAAASSVDMWRGTGPFGAIRTRVTTTVITADKGIYTTLLEN